MSIDELSSAELSLLLSADVSESDLAAAGIDRSVLIPQLVKRSRENEKRIDELAATQTLWAERISTATKILAAIIATVCTAGSIFAFILPYFADKSTVDRVHTVQTCDRVKKCTATKRSAASIKTIDDKLRKHDRRIKANRRFIVKYRYKKKIEERRRKRIKRLLLEKQ